MKAVHTVWQLTKRVSCTKVPETDRALVGGAAVLGRVDLDTAECANLSRRKAEPSSRASTMPQSGLGLQLAQSTPPLQGIRVFEGSEVSLTLSKISLARQSHKAHQQVHYDPDVAHNLPQNAKRQKLRRHAAR